MAVSVGRADSTFFRGEDEAAAMIVFGETARAPESTELLDSTDELEDVRAMTILGATSSGSLNRPSTMGSDVRSTRVRGGVLNWAWISDSVSFNASVAGVMRPSSTSSSCSEVSSERRPIE